jgi:hypothetical protein
MTPEKREELTNQLSAQGLTVLLTRDFDGILMQLARLAQFERLVLINDHLRTLPHIETILGVCNGGLVGAAALRPLEIADIPIVLTAAHKHLHDQLGRPAQLDPHTVDAAVTAFVAILCRR